jgi:outer membrane protein
MKYCSRFSIATVLTLFLVGTSAIAQSRIATIDMAKVFDNYWKTKQAKVALDERKADIEKEGKNMVDDYKKIKEDYQNLIGDANNQAFSADEREKRKKQAEDKLKSLKDLEDSIRQYEQSSAIRIREQGQRTIDNLVKEIRNIINAKAKTSAYALVLDTSTQANGTTPVVLYSSGEADITDAVLKDLNATAPAETSAPEKKSDNGKKSDKK